MSPQIHKLKEGDWFIYPKDESLWILQGRMTGVHGCFCLDRGGGQYQHFNVYPVQGDIKVTHVTDMPRWVDMLADVFELDPDYRAHIIGSDATGGVRTVSYKDTRFIAGVRWDEDKGLRAITQIPNLDDLTGESDVTLEYPVNSTDELGAALSAIWTELDARLSTQTVINGILLKPGDVFNFRNGDTPFCTFQVVKWVDPNRIEVRCLRAAAGWKVGDIQRFTPFPNITILRHTNFMEIDQ